MSGIKNFITAGVVSIALLAPAVAGAQSSSPTTEGYNTPGGVVQDQIQTQPARDSGNTPEAATQPAPAAASDEGGNLPFTGLDLALVVGAGGVLLLLGFGIRRFTRPDGIA
jgi:hypothetical protein